MYSNVTASGLLTVQFMKNMSHGIFTPQIKNWFWDRPSSILSDWNWKESKFKKIIKILLRKKKINSLSTRWFQAMHFKWACGCVIFKQHEVKWLKHCHFKKNLFNASFEFLCLKQPKNFHRIHSQGFKKLTNIKKWIWIHTKVCPIQVFSVVYLQLLLLMHHLQSLSRPRKNGFTEWSNSDLKKKHKKYWVAGREKEDFSFWNSWAFWWCGFPF